MTSGTASNSNPRLQRIDETLLDQHHHLNADDECYFFFEYHAGKGFGFSQTNSLISNLKKPPSKKGKQEYAYKLQAMATCSQLFKDALNPNWMKEATLVPIPPSKVLGHPEYDDRMVQICRAILPNQEIDVRELIVQRTSMEASHILNSRHTVDDLLKQYSVNEQIAVPPPKAIGIVDDVLTAGTHYRAAYRVLRDRFPHVPIVGFFIARRILPTPEAANWFADLNDL